MSTEFERIMTQIDTPNVGPSCPKCGAALAWSKQSRILGMNMGTYEWRCGNWLNGAGFVGSARCWLRSLMPWNKPGAMVVMNDEH